MLVTDINFSWFMLSINYCSFGLIMQLKFMRKAQGLKESIKYAILVDCYGNK